MYRTVIARAPTRLDLGGGWTDVPPYCDREGGFVCNVAISRYATATATRRVSDHDGELESPLIRAAIKRAGLATRASVQVHSDFPVAAGLGGSSSASAAVLATLRVFKDQRINRDAIAEEGRAIEVEEMGIAGGRQDHYAAAYGGALGLTFTKGVGVRRLTLSDATREALVRRSVLIYTGESRISGETITAVLGAYERGDTHVVRALAAMRGLAEQMAGFLERGDLDTVGGLLGEHWTHQRSLHPRIPTALIDEIVAAGMRAGALGAKAMGASGGGCVLLIAGESTVDPVRQAVAPLGELLSFGLDQDGVTILEKA